MAKRIIIEDEKDLRPVTQMIATFPATAIREAEATMTAIVTDLESETVRRTPVGAGSDLRSSMTGEVLPVVGTDVTGRVGSPLSYGLVVELGAGPAVGRPRFYPPPGALLEWVQKKLGIGDEKEARQVESAIRYTIWRDGIKGQHMVSEAWVAIRDRAGAAWARLLKVAPEKHWP